MVCCNYISNTETTVTYAYGGLPDDITGVVVFEVDGSAFEVVKAPDKHTVYPRSLHRLYGKYSSDFAIGNFKEKISFES